MSEYFLRIFNQKSKLGYDVLASRGYWHRGIAPSQFYVFCDERILEKYNPDVIKFLGSTSANYHLDYDVDRQLALKMIALQDQFSELCQSKKKFKKGKEVLKTIVDIEIMAKILEVRNGYISHSRMANVKAETEIQGLHSQLKTDNPSEQATIEQTRESSQLKEESQFGAE
jgi:hypothetical protein